MSAIEVPDFYADGYPVMEISLDEVRETIDRMEPYSQAGVAASQEYCLIANVIRELLGFEYVEVDYHGKPIKGVVVTMGADGPALKWALPEEIAQLAADFDREYGECDATREEALEWLSKRGGKDA
jgi:hypothetical protein